MQTQESFRMIMALKGPPAVTVPRRAKFRKGECQGMKAKALAHGTNGKKTGALDLACLSGWLALQPFRREPGGALASWAHCASGRGKVRQRIHPGREAARRLQESMAPRLGARVSRCDI